MIRVLGARRVTPGADDTGRAGFSENRVGAPFAPPEPMSHPPPPPPLPAHKTKHEPILQYPVLPTSLVLSLAQSDTAQDTTGTTLWLGAQVLAAYLSDTYACRPRRTPAPRAVDLGAGVGLTAHVLAALGFDVAATDVRGVVHTVLRRNVAENARCVRECAGAGVVEARELDWTVPPDQWDWNGTGAVAPPSPSPSPQPGLGIGIGPPFDLVVTADTLYRRDLVAPLVRTLRAVSVQSRSGRGFPPVFVALERRDPDVIALALQLAAREGFACRRVPHARVGKCMRAAGLRWEKEDWEGVEVWRWLLTG